ncbi:DEAD/DEAH box helicase [Desulfonatronovibrio hydrogenovorans]|uniref:DEAD/DEAH box helicase n=1 Tax=Desulfonatronovibrio hydrogenovorans TaxID=53245 RepID=UPI000555C830|nr:DEAD/DEAH box helicase [Desulfonatronovibrio hydrogenovorans]
MSIEKFIRQVSGDEALGINIVSHKVFPAQKGEYARLSCTDNSLVQALEKSGIRFLYTHQAEAINLVRSGKNVVVSTPTASGKSLIYNLPVFESILEDPEVRALYLFPLKALTQDQHQFIAELAGRLKENQDISSAVYDGDTDHAVRSMIKKDPPRIILTNPDMLHRSFLPYHRKWKGFFSGLKYVIVDEVHTYRGVMGSNMAWVFRRLARICAHYGREPVFIFSSATIRNPVQFTSQLTGMDCTSLTKSRAPQGKKHLLLVDPLMQGAAGAAIRLLGRALEAGLRTIVYTQSRKMTELIAMWCAEKAGPFKNRISAYRAGFLPEQRREIEAGLSSGRLLAVVSTSALELGIDIGHLDLCLLVGYPGSVMATRQRAGRVGRSGRDSAVMLIGHEDALDQYFLRHPQEFFSMEPESAVIDPYNPRIMSNHLVCAAADLPLQTEEKFLEHQAQKSVCDLAKQGRLIPAGRGDYYYTLEKYPHKDVDLRGSGGNYSIFDQITGEFLGDIDQARVFYETHPGAVYLHLGKTYLVHELSLETRSVFAAETRLSYYTRACTQKQTEIVETLQSGVTGAGKVCLGKLKVTEQVVGYEKRQVKGQRRIGSVPLDLPPVIFETQGIWLTIDPDLHKQIEKKMMHFMGGIHAVEHCLIGCLPLLILTDRNDLGGISTPAHEQLGTGAIFIYDGIPGGIGLCSQAFTLMDQLLDRAVRVISGCPCENGCPACVHSPKCGSGNRPLDKEAAMVMLRELAGKKVQPVSCPAGSARLEKDKSKEKSRMKNFAVLDIETRLSAQEVGGWGNSHLMGVSCSVVYDSSSNEFLTFFQEQTDDLGKYLSSFDLVVGFNLIRFDYRVLKGQSGFNFHDLPTLDILADVEKRLGHRLSLDHLAGHTLGVNKSASGLLALKWWKQGKMDKIIEYCRQDVAITRDLYQFGREQGHLVFQNRSGRKVRIPVDWN